MAACRCPTCRFMKRPVLVLLLSLAGGLPAASAGRAARPPRGGLLLFNSSGNASSSWAHLHRVAHEANLPPSSIWPHGHGAAGPNGNGKLEAETPHTLAGEELEGHGVLETNHGIAKRVLTPGFGGFLICMLVGAGFAQWRPLAAIPMSAWTILVSCIGGFMLRAMLAGGVISTEWYMRTTSTFLNLGLLPIIIFASGWSLNHLNFMSQLEHIAIFAVLGTLIATGVVGLALSTLGVYEFHMVDDIRSNFVFAALISAVDPVATLSTLAKLGLDASQPLLHTMIFGESIVNDAVAIVLFKAMNSGTGELEAHHVAFDVAKLLFGSWALGHLASCVLIFLLRCARLPGDTVPETLYIVGSAWFIFALAESVELSGIIANLWAGTMFKVYGSLLLEKHGVQMTSHFLEVAAEMCDTMVFMLCGVSSALVSSFRAIWFAMFAVLLCLVGRGLSTSICAVISNSLKVMTGAPEKHKLTAAHQVMMWHAGLRGGIALVLALEIDADWCQYKATIINTTFLIICVYLLAFGSTTEFMLRKFGFSGSGAEQDSERPGSSQGDDLGSFQGDDLSRLSDQSPVSHWNLTDLRHSSPLWAEVQEARPSSFRIRFMTANRDLHVRLLVGQHHLLHRKEAQEHWDNMRKCARNSPMQ